MVGLVVYPRQRLLSRYISMTFQHKVTDTNRVCVVNRSLHGEALLAALATDDRHNPVTRVSALTISSPTTYKLAETTTRPKTRNLSGLRAGMSL